MRAHYALRAKIMKRVCGPSSADLLGGDTSAALLDRVLSIFESRPSHQSRDGEHGEADSEPEVREQKQWKKQPTGTRGGRGREDQNRRRVLRNRIEEELQATAEPASGSATPMSGVQGARGAPVAESARELVSNLQEFKAMLDRQGTEADPALRERLGEVSHQLASVFLESGLKAPSTPSSASSSSGRSPAVPGGPAGTVRLHVDASMLRGSVGSFRDAQVEFQERQVVVRALDRGGRTWTLRSAKLPGPILADESRFQLGKSGKDLSITLKKAHADDIWHQEGMKFSEEGIWSLSSSGPDDVIARSSQAASSSGSGKAASDPGTSSRQRKKEAPREDYTKLGHAFI